MRHNLLVRKILILLLVVAALTSCNRSRSGASQRSVEMSPAEYEVLSAWIDDKVTTKKWDKGHDQIVISETTDPGDDHLLSGGDGHRVPWKTTADFLRKKDSALQQSTLDAFRKANTLKASVRPSLGLSIHYQIVSRSQLEPIFRKGGGWWPAYYLEFPGSHGLLTFSRLGFSADGTQAFFYYSNRCGGLCGVGCYVVMEKHDGRWVVQKEIEMWVS
jgi:hypothetical protein